MSPDHKRLNRRGGALVIKRIHMLLRLKIGRLATERQRSTYTASSPIIVRYTAAEGGNSNQH